MNMSGQWFCGYSKDLKRAFFAYLTGSTTALNNNQALVMRNATDNQGVMGFITTGVTLKSYYYDLNTDNYNVYTTSSNLPATSTNLQYTRINNWISNSNERFFYSDRKFYYNYWGSVQPAGTGFPSNAFAENFISSLKFDFEPTTNYRCTISGDTSGYQYYVISKTFANTLFGTFADSSYLDNIYLNFRAYQSGEGWQDLLTNNYDCSNNKVSNYFYTYTQDDIQYTDIKIKSNSFPNNCVVTFIFSPNIDDLDEKAYSFFIKNDKTIINNGVIDIQATINNDSNYANDINQSLNNEQNNQNSNNIQDIVNDLTNDNEINGMVSDYFPSGDNSAIASNMGFFNFYNPFLDFFDTIGYGIKNVLFGTRKCYFRYKSSWYY